MNTPLLNSDFIDLFDLQSLNETRIELLTEHLRKAARLSQSISNVQQRWQVYINALAVLGFEQWLFERAPDLQIESEQSSIWQPKYANLLPAGCNIWIDKFKLCIITGSNLIDEHSIPFAIFDIPDFAAHLYVLMQVVESKQQVAISGFLSYEQYCQYRQAAKLQIEQDWTYTIPQTCFNQDANDLLLNLRCLAADAIQLPLSTNIAPETVRILKQKLLKLKSQLKHKYPWQLLTVEEGITLLSSPELIDWVYENSAPSPIQPLINVANWLGNQVDAMTTELGWILMPSLRLSEMRSLENFDQVRTGLEQQGVQIPVTARGAYQDLECNEDSSLRLYAITWLLDSTTRDKPEWILLVVLGSQPQSSMPKTLKLELRDETQLLFEQNLKDTSQGILYAQVVGNYGERFWINITINEEIVVEIPPFAFELEETN
ncbi:Protein of unknown function (DUF1822) [Rivularia sp. PCC 7116]|uniref:DUF1822 family protein n=1 Tax=Rivularia sp. PCC 7116 TaxID=373994 RepID=UPI00029EDCDF|nr:DUF1822 family protein [Rivularia sp. PCC 7116]AFY57569.1 Protein of unknown function (DUF1822) [Rivularia sp. PCC 7116]